MNASQQITHSVNSEMNSMDYTEALEFCSEMMEVVEQDWGGEITVFEATDGSRIKFCGADQSVSEA